MKLHPTMTLSALPHTVGVAAPSGLGGPTPHTLPPHPTPHTLPPHPTPHTPHPTPHTPHPTPHTLHPTPYTPYTPVLAKNSRKLE
ncbi:MAG: hypothetical protein F6J93_11350 [Oscillatoria sp. SIO1A7]|nr:hypothetical protein [Oscillatoria sp. SIO1A7]